MERIKKTVAGIMTVICFIMGLFIIYFEVDNKSQNNYIVYFCPSTTAVAYGDKDAYLVEFDLNGNVKKIKEDAYPITALLNTENSILFQTNSGIGKLNKKNNNIEHINIATNANTCGYEMAGKLKHNNYYFFCNECLKGAIYSSKLIITNLEKSFVHDISGYINEYVNDEENIYIQTDDEKNKNAKIIQKISVNCGVDNINIESKKIDFGHRLEGFGKMVNTEDYIYSYVTNEDNCAQILKISKNTLEVEETFESKDNSKSADVGVYSQLSDESVFNIDNKMYCITEGGKMVRFDIDNNQFLEEYLLEGYDADFIGTRCDYFDKDTNEYCLFYQNLKDKYYYISIYDLNGKLVNNIRLDELKLNNKLCPYNIVKK